MVLMVLDGVDGAGKSTQAKKLCHWLRENGRTFCLRIHPSEDNFFGVKARELLLRESISTYVAASLFYMLDVLRSVLLCSWRRVEYVVFVRYLMGTAYLPSPLHRIAYHIFVRFLPTSDLMFFLKVGAREAHRRMERERRRRERFETL
jgi:dTMP kinase